MKKRTPVSKIMSSSIISVNKTQTLRDVSNKLNENDIRHVLVVSGDEVIGMLSKTDLHRISFVDNMEGSQVSTTMFDALSIEQVMTKELMTIQKDDTIYDTAVILSKNHFHALPVLDGKKLVGIVTTTDLLNYLIEQY